LFCEQFIPHNYCTSLNLLFSVIAAMFSLSEDSVACKSRIGISSVPPSRGVDGDGSVGTSDYEKGGALIGYVLSKITL
jgi:hypothetical protein